MKVLSLSIFLFSLSLLFSCSGNNISDKTKSDTPDASQASTNPSGKAGFSASIDGEVISGSEMGEMQLQNTAFIYPTTDNSGKRLLFFLTSDKKANISYSFRFSIPDKTGSFTKSINDGQSFDITLDYIGGDQSRYSAQSVTVNIISVSASNVTGTLSGKFTLSGDTPHGTKKEVTVTDGKFDIPFSTGNVRPE